MKPITKKISTFLFLAFLTALSARSQLLFQDSTNYPYTNGPIVGQGQWYSYSPRTPHYNTYVTNNTLLLVSTRTNDAVATPTNGWVNPGEFNFASFELNVSQLPATTNGGYFCQMQNINDTNDVCHLFIDTRNTSVPGTYRLGIGNFASSFGAAEPPNNYPMDLAPGVNYTVVMLYDTNQDDQTFVGATLWINPSQQDFQNVVDSAGTVPVEDAVGYVFGTDTTTVGARLNINISQIGFSPFIAAGVSNVIAATNFETVNITNLPVFGINPDSQTNYSGNTAVFYAVASAVDAAYQWYSSGGVALVDDGVNIIGSTSNTLTLNNLSATNYYYAIVTDAYHNTATSANATNYVITTPTVPSFTNAVANLTNNLFTQTGFTNIALGTGPLTYQWFFEPTNTSTFSPLPGQTSPTLYLSLADYSFEGSYYVTASNAVSGGSLTIGPTNSITELAPLVATLQQLNALLIASSNQLAAGNSFNVNTNNVSVTGSVSVFSGYGNGYTQFWLQDSNGYGLRVYLGGLGNTNTPPIGTSLTISGPIAVYDYALETDPSSLSSFITNKFAPTVAIYPKLENANFNDLATNVLGSNALSVSDSEVTFTNVYIYGTSTGGAIAPGTVFYTNGYTILYFTVGQYGVPASNTNTIEIFQPAYYFGTTNPFTGVPIPTQCSQLTGVYTGYPSGNSAIAEITPARVADYVTNPPPAFSSSITQTKGVPTVTWGPVQAGSTYSANTAPNANGPWTVTQGGLAYYPTNGSFTDTNLAPSKLYRMSSP